MKHKVSLIIAIVAASYHLSLGQVYQQLNSGQKINGQQSYVLPKGMFLIEVQTSTITYKKGAKLDGLAFDITTDLPILEKKYGINPDVVKKIFKTTDTASATHSLKKDSLKLSLIPVPDYTKIFFVDPKKKWNKNQSVTFAYTSDGILSEGESSVENKTFDLVVKGLTGAVSVLSAAYKSGGMAPTADAVKSRTTIKDLDVALEGFDDIRSLNNYEVYKDQKAILEKRYTSVFAEYFYSEKKKETTTKIYYIPAHESLGTAVKDVQLFSFDSGKIILNTLLKDMMWAKKAVFGPLGAEVYKLSYVAAPDQQIVHFEQRGNGATGFAFNIPAKVEAKISDGSNVYFDDFFKVPQFGILGYTKTNKHKVSFSLDPFGELKTLSITGNAITGDQIGATNTAATDLSKFLRPEGAPTKLESEVKRLENEKKRRDLLKELEQ